MKGEGEVRCRDLCGIHSVTPIFSTRTQLTNGYPSVESTTSSIFHEIFRLKQWLCAGYAWRITLRGRTRSRSYLRHGNYCLLSVAGLRGLLGEGFWPSSKWYRHTGMRRKGPFKAAARHVPTPKGRYQRECWRIRAAENLLGAGLVQYFI